MASNTQPVGVATEPMSEFLRDTAAFLEKMKASGAPVILRDESGAEVVVQDVQAYQSLLERVELLENVTALRESLEDVRAGRTRPFREVLDEIGRRHGLSR